jgi:hypothetical protein
MLKEHQNKKSFKKWLLYWINEVLIYVKIRKRHYKVRLRRGMKIYKMNSKGLSEVKERGKVRIEPGTILIHAVNMKNAIKKASKIKNSMLNQ